MLAIAFRVLALVVCALSLGMSFAHGLEAPPRLGWPPELWRDATVFHGQYALFGAVGGPIDAVAVISAAVAAVVAVRGRGAVIAAGLAAILFGAAFVVWLSVVQPANLLMAGWTPGGLPSDFEAIRQRWETGHLVMAGLKLVGFTALAAWAVRPSGSGSGLSFR